MNQLANNSEMQHDMPSTIIETVQPSLGGDGLVSSSIDQVESPIKLFGGGDNGRSGAVAFFDQGGNWYVFLVSVVLQRKHGLLNVQRNHAFLDAMVAMAGGPKHVVVAYERSRKNPMFGAKNNYVNGRNEEFWRVSL
ncbi:MAG: hypothetical protein ACREIC_04690 [Limisphaerales bacterium]